MNAGDTLKVEEPGDELDFHLWIIVSDPERDPARVLLLSVTTWSDDKDPACRLDVGDHPFITRPSCIFYDGPKLLRRDDLYTLLRKGTVTRHTPCSPELLERIRAGAGESTRLKMKYADILIEQGLIDV